MVGIFCIIPVEDVEDGVQAFSKISTPNSGSHFSTIIYPSSATHGVSRGLVLSCVFIQTSTIPSFTTILVILPLFLTQKMVPLTAATAAGVST